MADEVIITNVGADVSVTSVGAPVVEIETIQIQGPPGPPGEPGHVGHTGIVNLTASFDAAEANVGRVQVHRAGGAVSFQLSNFTPATSGRNTTVGTLPPGYRPALEIYGLTAQYWLTDGPVDDVRIRTDGSVVVQTTEGRPVHFNATFTTADPLPGTAV